MTTAHPGTPEAPSLDPDHPLLTERLLLRPIDPERDLAAMRSHRSREWRNKSWLLTG